MARKAETTGASKIFNFLQYLYRRSDFTLDLIQLREKYDIPQQGLESSKEIDYLFLEIPSILKPNLDQLLKDLEDLFFRYNTGLISRQHKIMLILFMYDVITVPENLDLIVIDDIMGADRSLESEKEMNKITYPIALRISPFAGRNDIDKFLDRHFSCKIKPLLDKYKDKNSTLGSVRSKPKQDVYDYIWDNPEKTTEELRKGILKHFEYVYGLSDINKLKHIVLSRREK